VLDIGFKAFTGRYRWRLLKYAML